MQSESFILFSLHRSLYGVPVQGVEEVFFLPELTSVAEAPRDITGVIDLRGEIVPILDLGYRFHNHFPHYQLNDSVIVLHHDHQRLGIVVNQVWDVIAISSQEITTHLWWKQTEDIPKKSLHEETRNLFIYGIARVKEQVVMLLDIERLIHHFQTEELLPERLNLEPTPSISEEGNSTSLGGFTQYQRRTGFEQATAEERETFRKRAESLRHQLQEENLTGLIPIAVVGLNNEYFGLELGIIREFTDINQITPIPCCPQHIVGNLNLRGEIVTLINICPFLNLPMSPRNTKATIVEIEDLVVAIAVDQVFDVIYIPRSQIKAIPTAIASLTEEYLRGTAAYADKMMSIVDLPKILLKGELIVNQEV